MLRKLDWLLMPSGDNALFAMRAALAGLTALFLSMWLQLDEPKWSLLTVFTVLHPISGMVVAKGFARLLGTLAAAIVAIVVVALFAQAPVFFVGALGLWLAVCVFFATLLRNFRGYGFVLAGYTTAIISLGAYQAPDSVFNLAVARSEEIGLGVLCATVYSILIAPDAAWKAYRQSLRQVLASLGDYLHALTSGRIEQAAEKLRLLLNQALALESVRSYARYDTAGRDAGDHIARRLHYELIALVTVAFTVQEHLRRRDVSDQERVEISAALDELKPAAEMMSSETPPFTPALKEVVAAGYERIRSRVIARVSERRTGVEWMLMSRVLDIASQLRSTLVLYDLLRMGKKPVRQGQAPNFSVPLELDIAWHNAARTFIAVAVMAGFWFASAWTGGAGALTQVAVFTALFAQFDDPIEAALPFITGVVCAIAAGFVYAFFIEPRISGFPMLTLTLFPLLFAAGLAMANPSTSRAGTGFGVFLGVVLDPSNMSRPQEVDYLNTAVGISVPMVAVVLAFKLLWPAEPVGRVNKQIRGMFAELAQGFQSPRHRFEARMYARIDRILPLLDALGATRDATLRGALAAITIGIEGRLLNTALRGSTIDDEFTRRGRALLRRLSALLRAYPVDAEQLHRVVQEASLYRRDIVNQAQQMKASDARRTLVRTGVTARIIGDVLTHNSAFFTGSLQVLPENYKQAVHAT